MSRPNDAACSCGQVSYHRWVLLILLILFLDLSDRQTVLVKQDLVLGSQRVFEVVSSKNGLEFSQKLERIFDACNSIKVLVNVLLEFCLCRRNIDIEFNEISIKGVASVVK